MEASSHWCLFRWALPMIMWTCHIHHIPFGLLVHWSYPLPQITTWLIRKGQERVQKTVITLAAVSLPNKNPTTVRLLTSSPRELGFISYSSKQDAMQGVWAGEEGPWGPLTWARVTHRKARQQAEAWAVVYVRGGHTHCTSSAPCFSPLPLPIPQDWVRRPTAHSWSAPCASPVTALPALLCD